MTGQAVKVLSARGAIRATQFIAFLLLARLMTSSEFGWFGILTTIIALATTLGSLGFRQAFAYEIGRKRLSTGGASLLAVILTPVLALASSGLILLIYGGRIDAMSPMQISSIILIGVGSCLMVNLIQGIYLGLGRITSFSVTEVSPRVIFFIIVLAISLSSSTISLSQSLWAYVIGFAAVFPVALWSVTRISTFRAVPLMRVPAMLRYGIVFAGNLFLITLCSRLSMFIVETYHGAEDAGQFFAAIRIMELFLESATAVGMVVFSNAVRSKGGGIEFNRNIGIARVIFLLFLFIAIGVALLAPYLLTIMLGSRFSAAGPVLQILALGLAPAAANKVIYPTLAGQGRPLFGTFSIATSLLVNLLLAFALVPSMGVKGGAIAMVAGQYVLFGGYALNCKRRDGIPLRSFLVPRKDDVRLISARIHSVLRVNRVEAESDNISK